MPEVRFGFDTPERLSGELAYAREPDRGGQLELRFTSPRLRRADGSDKWFTLGFNNIGPTDPLVFLESLDQGYLNDKLTKTSGHKPLPSGCIGGGARRAVRSVRT
jgi:hypothetical protein